MPLRKTQGLAQSSLTPRFAGHTSCLRTGHSLSCPGRSHSPPLAPTPSGASPEGVTCPGGLRGDSLGGQGCQGLQAESIKPSAESHLMKIGLEQQKERKRGALLSHAPTTRAALAAASPCEAPAGQTVLLSLAAPLPPARAWISGQHSKVLSYGYGHMSASPKGESHICQQLCKAPARVHPLTKLVPPFSSPTRATESSCKHLVKV